MPCLALPIWPQACGLVLIGIMMRFAERILGCRLGGYMCREFVGTASCVKTAGGRRYNRTAYRETRDRQSDPGARRHLKYGCKVSRRELRNYPHGGACRLKIWTIAYQIRRDVWSDRPNIDVVHVLPGSYTLPSRRGGSRLELGPSAPWEGPTGPHLAELLHLAIHAAT